MENLKVYSKFMVISYIIALILLCLVSVLLTYTNIDDSMLLTFVFVIVIITNLIGSTLTSRKIKKRGLLTGLVFRSYILFNYLFNINNILYWFLYK